MSRGLISYRRLVGSCSKMALDGSIIVETGDETMAKNVAQTSRNVGFLFLHVVLLRIFLGVLKILVDVFPFICCLMAMAILQSHT